MAACYHRGTETGWGGALFHFKSHRQLLQRPHPPPEVTSTGFKENLFPSSSFLFSPFWKPDNQGLGHLKATTYKGEF